MRWGDQIADAVGSLGAISQSVTDNAQILTRDLGDSLAEVRTAAQMITAVAFLALIISGLSLIIAAAVASRR
jgi:hypothetical protein